MDRIPLTPYRMTLILAYCHYYTPKFLPARCLSATHLSTLATWIGHPQSKLRTVRDHPVLAAHLLVGSAGGLLTVNEGWWRLTPAALAWLQAAPQPQIDLLRQVCQDEFLWQQTADRLGLRDTFNLAFPTFLDQQLAHLAQQTTIGQGIADWSKETADVWQLDLPSNLSLHTLFHLLQIGTWVNEETPGKEWACTGYSVAMAVQRGYSLTMIEAMITQAVAAQLTSDQHQQLVNWYKRHDAVRLRPAYLLETQQPAQLSEIFKRRRLREYVDAQISPRHALVSPKIAPALRRYLMQQGVALAGDSSNSHSPTESITPDPVTVCVGLRVVEEIGCFIPVSVPVDHNTLSTLTEQLSCAQQAEVEHQVQIIREDLLSAIRGRDAFFPAENEPDPALVAMIQTALVNELVLEIAYQGLGELMPRWRQISPLRLEERGSLIYLYTYCYLAEAERTFRLDRIKEWRIAEVCTEW